MKILVCGGRDFVDREFLYEKLDSINISFIVTEVIHGDQRGADRMAGDWALNRGIKQTPVPADWIRYGQAAGPIRNREMLKLCPDMVIAFDGNKGTADMVNIARKAQIPVIIFQKEIEDLFK